MGDTVNVAANAAAATVASGPLATPEVAQLVSDAKADAASIAQQAIADAQAQVATAATAAGKLLAIAAGDETTLLTDAEAAAISIVAHNVPPAWQAGVLEFAALASSKVEGPLNAIVGADTQKALAWSYGWLTMLQEHITSHL